MNPIFRRGLAFVAIFAVLSFTLYLLSPGTPSEILDNISSKVPSSLPSFNCDVNFDEDSELGPPSLQAECDPYTTPGTLVFDQSFANPRYVTFDDKCKPAAIPWMTKLKESVVSKTPIPELQNKEVLLVGDSVDREGIHSMCKYIGLEAKFHAITSYKETGEAQNSKEDSGLPSTCIVEHLNLTISNWFFYGYDEDNIWGKTNAKHPNIGEFSNR
jgi:hypothetical protein